MERLSGAPSDLIGPNGLAFVILSSIPFFHYLFLNGRSLSGATYILILSTSIYTLFLTASRSGYVAVVGLIAIIFLRMKRKVVAVAAVVAIILIFPTVFLSMDSLHQDRILSIFRSDVRGSSTAEGRFLAIEKGLGVFASNPVFGYGIGTSLEANWNVGGEAKVAHNLYVEVLEEIGLCGTLLFLAYVWSGAKVVWKMSKGKEGAHLFRSRMGGALLGYLAVLLIFSLVSYGLSSYEWYLFGGLARVTSEWGKDIDGSFPNRVEALTT
jgi:O-antigen ligase